MTAEELQIKITQEQALIDEKRAQVNELNKQVEKLEALAAKYTKLIASFEESQISKVAKLKEKSNLVLRSQIAKEYISGMDSLLAGKEYQDVYAGLVNSKARIKDEIIKTFDLIEVLQDEIRSHSVDLSAYCNMKFLKSYSEDQLLS